MTKKLCIYWEANGGRGYSSPQEDTPENRKSLEDWAAKLQHGWPNALFTVTEPPFGRSLNMAGSVLTRQPQQ